MFNKEDTLKFLLKGTEKVDPVALKEKVEEVHKEGRVLNIKFGMDPSAQTFTWVMQWHLEKFVNFKI